jgi:cytochrome c biogenesis protein CcdA/glutaredoxin
LTRKYYESFLRLVFPAILISTFFPVFTNASPKNITIYYFVAEGCEHCARAESYINTIKTQYPDVVFKRFDIFNNDTNIGLFIALAEGFNITEEAREVPAVFIGDTCLIGEEEIIRSLENTILKYVNGEYYDKADEIVRRFIEEHHPTVPLPSVINVVIAASIDSLNPCAFAAIILLLTYSVSASSSGRVLANCGAFIIGVLISYLSAGLGILYLINIAPFKVFIRYLVGLMALVFASLEFKEFLFYGRVISLEQPSALSRIINKYSTNMTTGASFLIGMAVSMVELPCTGGIYMTVLYLLAKIGLTLEVLLLLLLYNLIFVLPLVIIALLTYFGRSLLEIDAWRIEKRRYMRLIAGVLLVIVGVAIITGFI